MLELSELELLFDLSLDLHCVAGVDGYFKHLNPAFESTLGYTREELTAKPFIEFVHPEDRAATIAALEALSNGRPVVAYENRYQCADGSVKILQWNAAPDPHSNLIVATARDVTTLREMQAEIEKSRHLKALGDVAASVSHDLRNVLTPVVTMSTFLTEQLKSLHPQSKTALDLIRRSGERGVALVEKIMCFGSDAALEVGEVDLRRLVKDVFEVLPERIETSISINSNDLTIQGDSTQLFRAFLNLCNNACDAMPEAGTLEVVVNANKNVVAIKVIDSGPGIPESLHEKVFEPFFSTRRDEGGAGLGLAIVRKIVNQHGGVIRIEASDDGTCFSLVLPIN